MASIKGTQTEKNLLKSFAGESQARNRYTYFAKAARNEGFVQIADIFEETANQEKEHAKQFFKHLEGGMVEITACYPAGIITKTIDNLKAAAGGEHEEWTSLYPSFAETAEKEGFNSVAELYTAISVAEKQHEKRYLDLLKNVEDGTVFKKSKKVVWRCRNCGYIHEGEKAMSKCPACMHPQAHFEVLSENY
jgi:rubrerythrin